MVSGEKEHVPFSKFIKIRSEPLEKWMNSIEEEMRKTVQKKIGVSYTSYQNVGRKEWVVAHCG